MLILRPITSAIGATLKAAAVSLACGSALASNADFREAKDTVDILLSMCLSPTWGDKTVEERLTELAESGHILSPRTDDEAWAATMADARLFTGVTGFQRDSTDEDLQLVIETNAATFRELFADDLRLYRQGINPSDYFDVVPPLVFGDAPSVTLFARNWANERSDRECIIAAKVGYMAELIGNFPLINIETVNADPMVLTGAARVETTFGDAVVGFGIVNHRRIEDILQRDVTFDTVVSVRF